MSRRAKPRIGIYGAGKVGQSIGRALVAAGLPIGDVVCRSKKAANAAVRFIGEGIPASFRGLSIVTADVLLVTVPDDTIGVASRLLASLAPSGVVALHSSGALNSSELAALRDVGLDVGSMHPLRSFARPDPELLRGSLVAAEGDRAAVAMARRLAKAMGSRFVVLASDGKGLYHAAAVLGSGGVTSLLDMSIGALEAAGLSREDAIRSLLVLTEGTIANISAHDTTAALTGPFARGDEGTIERNLQALREHDPAIAAVYEALGTRAREIARRRKRRS